MNKLLDSELQLYISDVDHEIVKKGTPAFFLRSRTEYSLFEEPTAFLCDRYVNYSSTASANTWAKAAYSLKTWLEYLQCNEIDWQDANEEDRINFRDDFLQSVSPRTGEIFGKAGIRDTLTVIRQFYIFLRKLKLYFGNIGDCSALAKNADTVVYGKIQGSRFDGNLKCDEALPKLQKSIKVHPIMVTDLRKLLVYIGPQASCRAGDSRRCRDRIICDLGWAVGLRLSEIINLNVYQFLQMDADVDGSNCNLPLTIYHGKGAKTRQVAIPAWLVLDVQSYINFERRDALLSVGTTRAVKTKQLFVAHQGTKSAGSPIGCAAVQKMFRDACINIGLTIVKKKINCINQKPYIVISPRHSMHDLRHTFAVLKYHAERLSGNTEPWKKIQAQLGHKYLQTTIDTYLNYVEIFDELPGLLSVRKLLGI